MDSCSQFIIGYIRSNEAGALFAFRRRRGVSCLFAFRPSRCRLASVRYLVRVWGFTSIPFSCKRSTISCVSKPRFFIRSSVGARAKTASFMDMVRFPSSVTEAGLSVANSCLISFSCVTVMVMKLPPVFRRGHAPD